MNLAHKSHWNKSFGWTQRMFCFSEASFRWNIGHNLHFNEVFMAANFLSCFSWNFWWFLKLFWVAVLKSHRWYLNDFWRFLLCVLWCEFKFNKLWNFFLQISHLKLPGLPWLSLICLTSLHLNGFDLTLKLFVVSFYMHCQILSCHE